MKSRPIHIVFILLTASYPRASSSPAIAPQAQDKLHSQTIGNAITISASLSLGVPRTATKGLLPPAPPLLTSTFLRSTTIHSASSPPSTPTHVQATLTSSGGDNEAITPSTVLWLPHSTDPLITSLHPAKSTWIQDDYPPQPPTNTSHPLQPTLPPGTSTDDLTCGNYPTHQSITTCSPVLLVILFVLFYTAILRTVLYLQEISARQVLELGEVLTKHRDSFGGYAWEGKGSWKVRQQPELPAIAMLTVNDMERIVDGDDGGGGKGYGTMDGGLATGERIWLEDLDYRRRKVRRGNNTPEEQSIVNGKGKSRANDEDDGREEEGAETELTPEQRRHVEQKRREMVKRAHDRMLNDTNPKRVFYGAVLVFLSVGVAFAIFAALFTIICRQILKVGKCPFQERG
ncbi:hypothetical protein TWF481_005010 [Arthrobotrys musiformis]|uniref:Uncharacterized protein n=1 Tax=Arthrobotrys musiformis TaxID=47236 RepID=A0AAV9WLF6_9PEZI